MMFERLEIKNFRAIGPQGLQITFAENENLAVIVGANGSGKTTVLQALGMVLGVYPMDRVNITSDDFHKGSSDADILIELHLRDPLRRLDVYQKPYFVHGFRLRYWRKKRAGNRSAISREHYCFGEDGKNLVKPSRLYKKGDDEEVDNSRRPVLVDDVVDELGEFFYLEPPRLETFFDRTSGYSPLGRLFDIYRNDFPSEQNTHTGIDGKTRPSIKALEAFSVALAKVLRTPKLDEIENRLSKRVAAYSGDPSRVLKVQLGLPNHQELFESIVALQVSDRSGQKPLPVAKLGTGHRALLRLAVIDALLSFADENQHYTLLVEEPESYLHVHLRRYFAGVLQSIASNGHQVVVTTHAPEFADLNAPQQIVRIDRPDEGSVAFQVPSGVKPSFPRIKVKVRGSGNEELFFAERVILTEGQDDQLVVRSLLRLLGIDADAHGISVLDCKAKGNLTDYITLCGYLGIDFFVVHDEDAPSHPSHKLNKKILDGILAVGGTAEKNLALCTPNLESECGLPHHAGIEAVASFLERTTIEQLKKDHSHLLDGVERFVVTRSLV